MSKDKQKERQVKVDSIIKSLTSNLSGVAMLTASLKSSGYGMMTVVTKDAFPEVVDPVRLSFAKKGIVLDVETTGVETSVDEITELAMIEFFYDDKGIIKIGEVFDEFNEPKTKWIDADVEALTGITNEMVAGKIINRTKVKSIVKDSDIIIAHHASFDRKMVENNLPDCGFDTAKWYCSVNDVEWLKRGKSGRSLEVLALSEGLVYGSHRADADCLATLFILNGQSDDGKTAFAELLERGGKDTLLLIAEGAPFAVKDALKNRKYRWAADGTEAFGIKAWYTEILDTPEDVINEEVFLRSEVYKKNIAIPCYRIDATSRYSERKPGAQEFFRTADVKTLVEAADQRDIKEEMGDFAL